jgi:hypothetical protein
MITISNTELAVWDRCRRMWLALYYFQVAPAEEAVTGNRLLGIRVHSALEGYYGYELDPLDVLKVIYLTAAAEHPDHQGELMAEHDMANAMVEGYLDWVAETGADADLEIVATEKDLQIPMPGRESEVLLRCRMDQVGYRASNDTLIFVDHKTSPSFERHEMLELDVQMPHYCLLQKLAAASAGPDAPLVAGGAVNTLRRVKRTARSKPPYYQRDYFSINPDQVATAWHRANAIVKEILAARYHMDWFFSLQPDMSDPHCMELLNLIQREYLRPTPIITDCSWRCPLARGLCAAMSDGSDWVGMMNASGAWKRVDPYSYYRDDALSAIRASLSGTMDPDQEAGSR